MQVDDEPATPRDDLISAVQAGRISLEHGRAEANRLGLPPLEGPADPDALDDPARMPAWTLPMALAWIVWRDIQRLRAFERGFRSESGRWVEHRTASGAHWRLEPLMPATLGLVELVTIADRLEGEAAPPTTPYPEAIDALWIGLRSGAPEATGIDGANGARVAIPDPLWSARPLDREWGETVRFDEGAAARVFRDVRVSRPMVQSLWRAPPATTEVMRLPPVVRPEGLGDMTLFQAALWIATEGGTIDFHPESPALWTAAYDALLAAIVGGAVRTNGVRDGLREAISGEVFSGIAVDYPYDTASLDMIFSTDFRLRSYPDMGDAAWRDGLDDAITRRGETRWSRIMVDRPSVARLWPTREPTDTGPRTTGYPGRPSATKTLIDDEFARRVAEGRIEPTLSGQARALLDWVAVTHPGANRPSPKTVENALRAPYRQAKAPK